MSVHHERNKNGFIIAGHQPHYLPWIGYFNKIYQADVFCLVDTIQFEKRWFQNRNKVLTAAGEVILTVPVITHDKFHQRIADVEIDNRTPWRRKHWKTMYVSYHSTPYFRDYAEFFEDVYAKEWTKLVDLNEHIIRGVLSFLGIQKEIVRASTFNPIGQKTDLLIDICKKTGASGYLSGAGGAKDYVNEVQFVNQGLTHKFQTFVHPTYTQIHTKTFIPKLAVIDLLFNEGSKSGDIVRGC